jgi:hypothetical protein
VYDRVAAAAEFLERGHLAAEPQDRTVLRRGDPTPTLRDGADGDAFARLFTDAVYDGTTIVGLSTAETVTHGLAAMLTEASPWWKKHRSARFACTQRRAALYRSRLTLRPPIEVQPTT